MMEKRKGTMAMNAYAFLGGFAAVALGIYLLYRIVSRKLRQFSRQVFGKTDILEALGDLDLELQETPRSLNACDSLLLPQILRDFPDYDPTLAKTYVRRYLTEQFGSKEGFTIHAIATARYLPSAVQKTIVFQASVSWLESGKRSQKRFDLHYTYLLESADASVAANCPNCGAALGYGITECPYCSSRVANVLGNTWKFTQITQS